LSKKDPETAIVTGTSRCIGANDSQREGAYGDFVPTVSKWATRRMKVATRYCSGISDGELLIAADAGDCHALEEIPAMKPTVYVVDDDAGIREALDAMLTSAGMNVVTCASTGDYFRVPKPDLPSCLILDVALPDGSGIDLQRQLSTGDHPPIIFLTGASDIPTAVRAIKAGAIDFLTKPWRKADLLAAIETAIAQDCLVRAERAECLRLKYRHSCLTPREREVLPLVVGGLLNKQAAARLGISETTLQIHRSRIMRKMRAESLAQLVRIAGKLAVPLPRTKSH
jgi:FixJ family two-component response regulator